MRDDERRSGGVEDLDARIDAALRRYAEAPEFSDPRVVLARVRMLADQKPRSRWSVWMWAVPAGVAALIAVVALVWLAQRPTSPQIALVPKSPGVASVEHSSETVSSGAKAPRMQPHLAARLKSCPDPHGCGNSASKHAVAKERTLPKLDVFPAPRPLSAGERALVAFAIQAPPDLRKQVVETQKHLGDPIQIAAIEIRPLNEDEQKTEPKGKDMR